MNVHPDICLAGCVLHMFDMDRMFTDKLDLPNIVLAIRMHGGDIEFGAKAYAERAGAITHVIVESIRTQHAHLALKDRKRLVTMQWLVDVLMKKQMDVPWRHAHLPSVFTDGCRPLLGKLISFSGFDESERAAMKFMVEAMGARFTPRTLAVTIIFYIAKTGGVEKVEKRLVNGISRWLIISGWLTTMLVKGWKLIINLGQPCDGVSPGPYALEMINDQFKQLLLAWKMPLIVSPEQWRRSFDTKQAVENDEGVFPNKKLRMQSAPPSEAEIAAKAQEHKKSGTTHPAYVVA
ncbi:BRCA1 protein [Ostertagia ostertagi]